MQNWFFKNSGSHVSHVDGMAHVLNSSAGQEWAEKLDTYMRLSMIYPIVSFIILGMIESRLMINLYYSVH